MNRTLESLIKDVIEAKRHNPRLMAEVASLPEAERNELARRVEGHLALAAEMNAQGVLN